MSKNLENPKAKLIEAVKQDMQAVTPYLEALLPHRGEVERFRQMTHLAIMRSEKLLECNRKSLLLALLWCAHKNLEPGVDDGAWLVPYKGMVVPVPSFKGLMNKAVESGSVKDIQPYPIFEHDDFEYGLGLTPFLTHNPPKLGVDRGKLIGAYVIIVRADDSKRFHVMDRTSVEKIRNSSAAWRAAPDSGIWKDWEEKMFLKTVIKQGLKYLPVAPLMRDLLADDGRLEAGAGISRLLQESGIAEPEEIAGMEEDEVVTPPAPDTSVFDKLVTGKNLEPERSGALETFLSECAMGQSSKGRVATVPDIKVRAAKAFEKFWTVFEAWEKKQAPPQEPEPEPGVFDSSANGNGEPPESGQPDYKAMVDNIHKAAVSENCLGELLKQFKINQVTDLLALAPEMIPMAAQFVADHKAQQTKKGKK